jgi:hypothetical protein
MTLDRRQAVKVPVIIIGRQKKSVHRCGVIEATLD